MTVQMNKRILALILAFGLSIGPAWSKDIRSTLFAETDAMLATALEVHADVLSPKNFSAAESAYKRAEKQVDRGRADKTTKELQKVNSSLAKAIEASKLAEVTLRDSIKFRNLALAADAEQHEPELWKKAEKTFTSAATWLESGNVKRAQKASTKALNEFATAELEAIKTSIVGEARNLIADADNNRVERYAPNTLATARALVVKAEGDLATDRYSTAEPGVLAAEAEYEARHASYLASQAKALKSGEITTEQLILEWETPLREVATALEVSNDMSAGYAEAGAAAQSKAVQLSAANSELTARVSELEIALGGTEMLVEETERLQRQLAQIEDLFPTDQARVIREGNDLILRLVGLSFPTGQSHIQSKYFGMLKKVQDTIAIFPNSVIVVEGHTDSQGADNTNVNLSQDRADSVREYLLATSGLPADRVSSIGYGKTSPIANNGTVDGRAQNRRIDVVILDARARVNSQANSSR